MESNGMYRGSQEHPQVLSELHQAADLANAKDKGVIES